VISHSYVKLPEGTYSCPSSLPFGSAITPFYESMPPCGAAQSSAIEN
jgi:hypothetical protein